jgi:1,4-dihydroxy-2-naphthoate octaprenyltransferase
MEIATALEKLRAYPHVTVSWIDDDGYPMQTPATFDVRDGGVLLRRTGTAIPSDREVNVIASHIRPQPGTGYDQRRYVSVWGRVAAAEGGGVLAPSRAWGWDEAEMPFFEYSERNNARARAYMHDLSNERGQPVRPRLSTVWTALLTTRLPFLTATLVPVLLGVAVAAYHGAFEWWLALVTIIGACAIHVGLNTANDVFDALSGADEANVNPTQFSGGSRVIQRGLVSLRQVSVVSISAYAVGIGAGLFLLAVRPSVELLAIGVAGVFLSVFYTAPPFRLVHRGLGEITTAIGFGPLMVLGAYAVQAQSLSWEPFVASVPVAIFVALILYVNEIPDRNSDASVGKRTLPVRLSANTVTRIFIFSAIAAFGVIAGGVAAGVLPEPTLLALLALPLAFTVWRGLRAYYGSPYELMPYMGKNVQLHLLTGVLLFAGYVIAIAADEVG